MKRFFLFGVLAGASLAAAADPGTCMVSPTASDLVNGRFGEFRAGGKANFGSGNKAPHIHDGLDFSTAKVAGPLYAAADGVVASKRKSNTAGNTLMIKRDDGGDSIVYYHATSYSVEVGDKVKAGQQIGLAGTTGMDKSGGVHLHFIYGVPNKDDVRAKMLNNAAIKNKTFNPAQLPTALSATKKEFKYATDPSPYFCKTYPFKATDELNGLLGKDTKAQYAIMFGNTPPMGVPPAGLAPVQVAAANAGALQAAAAGATTNPASSMSDADGFGALPSAPIGGYDSMSPADMMGREAGRRFADAEWNANIATVSSRALWVDYLRAVGVANYISEMTRLKKERVESLLALYTAQKLASIKTNSDQARQRAASDELRRVIK